MGRENNGTAHDPKQSRSVKHGGGNVMSWACRSASGTVWLLFINDLTTDKSIRMCVCINHAFSLTEDKIEGGKTRKQMEAW